MLITTTNFIKYSSFLILVLFTNLSYAGTVDEDGNIHLTMSWLYFPTQEQELELEQALVEANNLICDATDGFFRLGNIRIVAATNQYSEIIDVYITTIPGRSSTNFFDKDLKGINNDSEKIYWFLTNEDCEIGLSTIPFLDGKTLAHELGHYVLGLGDEYVDNSVLKTKCRTGICIENQDSQNNTLMGRHVNATER